MKNKILAILDRMRKKALSQSILNLGENTKLLEKWMDLTLSSIDWRGLKGMRDISAHRYHTLDNEIIFDVAKNHIPSILEYLRQQYLAQQKNAYFTLAVVDVFL